jgi:hypothetical protein
MPGGGKAEPLPPHDAASVVKYYGDKGYSVIGPVKIVSVTQDVITLPTFPESEKNPISVYLTGRTVTLKSFGSTDSATETLQPGEMVIICQKDKQVVIYRLGRQKASGSEMNDANR